jgi:hypothetical protein
MSSFKQRLGNAVGPQLNFGTPNQNETSSPFAGRETVSSNTGKKSNNVSRISGSGSSSNVLSERVSRISEKIHEIHVSILSLHLY